MRQPIVTTPGVIRVLGSGSEATSIEDSGITSLQLAVKAQAVVEPWPFLQTGKKVWITEGTLSGVEGILVEAKQSPRIVLSVSLLQRSVLLEVDRSMVSSVWSAACSAN
jgi:transcription antitermination factor NusG